MTLTLSELDKVLMTDLRYVRSRLDRLVDARLAGRLARQEQEEFALLCRVEHELMDAHQTRATSTMAYVSTACRLGHHDECGRRIVRDCPCECHEDRRR